MTETEQLDGGLRNLAMHVRARRDELELTQVEVWKSGGPSNTTLTQIENAQPPSPSRKTRERLELALSWRPGSVRDVLLGGDPTPIADPSVDADSLDALARIDRATREYPRNTNTNTNFDRHDPRLEARLDAIGSVLRFVQEERRDAAVASALQGVLQHLDDDGAAQLGRELRAAHVQLRRPSAVEQHQQRHRLARTTGGVGEDRLELPLDDQPPPFGFFELPLGDYVPWLLERTSGDARAAGQLALSHANDVRPEDDERALARLGEILSALYGRDLTREEVALAAAGLDEDDLPIEEEQELRHDT